MKHKICVKSMVLGVVIMLIGLAVGAVVSPPLIAQRNGVFDEIVCSRLRVIDKHGKDAIVLLSGDGGNGIAVYDKHKSLAFGFVTAANGNGMIVQDKAGKNAFSVSTGGDTNRMLVYDKAEKPAVVLAHHEKFNIVAVWDKTGENIIGLDGVKVRKDKINMEKIAEPITVPGASGWIEIPSPKSSRDKVESPKGKPLNRVATSPSYSDYLRAKKSGDAATVNKLLDRATELRSGLEFPIDTFAVDRGRGIVVAHTSDGNGVIGANLVGLDFVSEWLTFERHGNLRIVTYYEPAKR